MTFKQMLKMVWKLRVFSLAILVVVCFLTGAECKRSACWRYGHVCWGGHGKRSGIPPQVPQIPYSTAVVDGSEDGSYSLPSWGQPEENSAWKFNSKQALKFPIFFNVPSSSSSKQSVHILEKESPNFRRQQRQLLTKTKSNLPGHLLKSLMQQHDGPLYYETDDLTKNTLEDSLIVPDPAMLALKPRAIYPVTSLNSYSTVLKRTSDNAQEANTGGTEEPLQTASNGLDSEDSGSIATFFRERKLRLSPTAFSREDSAKEKEKYSTSSFPGKERMDTLRAAKFNSPLPLNLFPIVSPYQSEKNIGPPIQSQVYYRLR